MAHRIAVIAGDGIGTEVMPEGLRVLDTVARRFGIGLQWDHFDFSSWPYFEKHGQMLPSDWKDRIGGHDAIYFGAVGMPDKIPDHVSLWGSLLLFRREFDQYINLRPARLMPGKQLANGESLFDKKGYTLRAPASRAICTISRLVVPRTIESSTNKTCLSLNSLTMTWSF